MKVTLSKDYRKLFTLEEMDIARKLIREMKDDEMPAREYADVAVNYILNHHLPSTGGYFDELLKASFEITRNGFRWEAYADGYRDIDIWFTGVAKTSRGYLEFGIYMTDVWSIGGDFNCNNRVWAKLYTA